MTHKRLAVGSWSSGSTRTEDWLEAAIDMAHSVDFEQVADIEDAEHALGITVSARITLDVHAGRPSG